MNPFEEMTTAPQPEHEVSDFNLRAVARLGLLFLAGMAVVLAVSSVLLMVVSGRAPNLAPQPPLLSDAPQVTPPPVPRLQPAPLQDLQQFRSREDAILHGFGWVDQSAGITRIPIERAMELLLQRGLPTRADAESQRFKDKGEVMPADSSAGRTTEQVRP